MQRLTKKNGVELETDVHADMQAIVNEMTDAVRKKNSNGSLRRIFWDEQLKALQTKYFRQVHWHPALLKWCLHLKFKSTSAYHALRSTGVLTLPSERTLFDYSHYVRGEIGFQAKMNDQLLEEVDQAEGTKKKKLRGVGIHLMRRRLGKTLSLTNIRVLCFVCQFR